MIHETAVIGKQVELGNDVEVGPYTVIEGETRIGDGTRIGPRVHICGWTTIGKNCKIHANAVIGDEPQDHDFGNETSYCVIGDDTVLREFVTVHRATGEGNTTSIGNHCMLMGFVHVGHNVTIGNYCNFANTTMISGHAVIEDRANLSGSLAVHQFCRIGSLSMLGPYQKIRQDIPPYVLVDEGQVFGPNNIGLKRAGIGIESRKAIKDAVGIFFFSKKLREEARAEIQEKHGHLPEIVHFLEFTAESKRGFISGRGHEASAK